MAIDDRVLERYFERAVEAVAALTNQVRRVANAVESQVLQADAGATNKYVDDCGTCGCKIVLIADHHCPGCGAFVRRDG